MEFTRSAKADHDKAIKILAKSVLRNLKAGGYTKTQIVSFTSEVIGLLTKGGEENAAT